MPIARPAPSELPLEELRALRALSQRVDALVEQGLRGKESLAQLFRRCLPEFARLCAAESVAVTARDEGLELRTWSHGEFGAHAPGKLLARYPEGVAEVDGWAFVSQPLDVAGLRVGALGLRFSGEEIGRLGPEPLVRRLEAVAEELDAVLALVEAAAERHRTILNLNEALADPVFDAGLDRAVLLMAERVRLPGLALLFRDAVDPASVHYRTYAFGRLEHASGQRPSLSLEHAVERHGPDLVARADGHLRSLVGGQRHSREVVIGSGQARPLGKLVAWADQEGLSAAALDLVEVLGATLGQRLMDYHRERIHLSQFFSNEVIDHLLRDPEYARHLWPQDEEVGILFADINGFTRICEQVLDSPTRIGRFVDRWSDGVVDLIWSAGGVFDKMVGDCVIGLFGPPLFRADRLRRAEATVKAALEIQAFTQEISSELPEAPRIREVLGTSGLGVAIGANLARTYCGLFGPNQHYTGFSTGMNQTARLQALAGFRETLLMEPLWEALADSVDPMIRALRFGPLEETAVKNVSQPLRYFRLESNG
jgi:adenylate cyclase